MGKPISTFPGTIGQTEQYTQGYLMLYPGYLEIYNIPLTLVAYCPEASRSCVAASTDVAKLPRFPATRVKIHAWYSPPGLVGLPQVGMLTSELVGELCNFCKHRCSAGDFEA